MLVNGFSSHGKQNPIKAAEIVSSMNKFLEENHFEIRITEARLRKCCNHIRTNGILPLIATSSGYYVSNDKEEIRTQIQSLYERASSIKRSADGLRIFIM
jgi:hypothetical protein